MSFFPSFHNADFDGDEVNLFDFSGSDKHDIFDQIGDTQMREMLVILETLEKSLQRFNLLNDDVILEIALNLDTKSIANFCNSNSRYHRLICNNEVFWHLKFKRDYFDIKNYTGSWKHLYLNYNLLHTGTMAKSISPIQIHSSAKFKPKQINNQIAVDDNGSVWVYKTHRDEYQNLLFVNDEIGWTRIPIIKAKMACINQFSQILYIDHNDDVYLYGANNYSNLMISNKALSRIDRVLVLGVKAKYIAMTNFLAAIIDQQGNVHIMGRDYNGPRRIPNIIAKRVYCYSFMLAIIDIHDNVYVLGENCNGELGLGHNNPVKAPQMIPGFRAKGVLLNDPYMAIIDLQDRLWVFGPTEYNDLTNAYITTHQLTPFHCRGVFRFGKDIIIIDMDNGLYSIGTYDDYLSGRAVRDPIKLSDIKVETLSSHYDVRAGYIIHIIGTIIKK